jgi:hypothetical protein
MHLVHRTSDYSVASSPCGNAGILKCCYFGRRSVFRYPSAHTSFCSGHPPSPCAYVRFPPPSGLHGLVEAWTLPEHSMYISYAVASLLSAHHRPPLCSGPLRRADPWHGQLVVIRLKQLHLFFYFIFCLVFYLLMIMLECS